MEKLPFTISGQLTNNERKGKHVKINNIYVADFETTTYNYDNSKSKVWLSYIENIYDESKSSLDFSIEEFFSTIIDLKQTMVIYFNNLSFDGQFILHYLSKIAKFSNYVGYTKKIVLFNDNFTMLMDTSSNIYSITYKTHFGATISFLCSYKLLNLSVSQAIGVEEKKKIDYDIVYTKNNIPQEVIDYIKLDVRAILKYIKQLYLTTDKKLIGITSASSAIKDFVSTIGKSDYDLNYGLDIILPGFLDENNLYVEGEWDYFAKGYVGGYNYMGENVEKKIISRIVEYDVNSLYPYIMWSKNLPCQRPIYNCSDKNCNHLIFYEVDLKFKAKSYTIPFIPNKPFGNQNQGIEWLKNGIKKLFLTKEYLNHIKQFYIVEDIIFLNEIHFNHNNNFFKKFIDKWQYVKQNAVKDSYEYKNAKLKQNSSYGKFGQKPLRKRYKMVLDDGRKYNGVKYNKYILDYDWDLTSTSYIPLAIWITSLAKIKTTYWANIANNLCQCLRKEGCFLYSDTDSLHLNICQQHQEELETMMKIDDVKLGCWDKKEKKYGYYFKRKIYITFDNLDDILEERYIATCGFSKQKLTSYTARDIINLYENGEFVPIKLSATKIDGGIFLKEKGIKV